jgi:hypothetical protein
MPDVASVELFGRRLQASLSPIVGELRRFLADADGDRKYFIALLSEDDARSAAYCLLRLGLDEDARHLAWAWRQLHGWSIGRIGEVAAQHVQSSPEQALHNEMAVQCAHRLLVKLEQVQATLLLPEPADVPPVEATAATQRILRMPTEPGDNDEEPANPVVTVDRRPLAGTDSVVLVLEDKAILAVLSEAGHARPSHKSPLGLPRFSRRRAALQG